MSFARSLHWLASHGVRVERFNPAQQPQAFAASEPVRAALAAGGNECLPLILVDGSVVSQGVYPDRRELAALAGLSEQLAAEPQSQPAHTLPVISG